MKNLFAFVVLAHGLIHLMGFAKAFGFGDMNQLTRDISKPMGIIWLAAAASFTVTVVLLFAKKENWPAVAITASVISQILIILAWHDARFGTIANVVILMVATLTLTTQHFESQFRKDVEAHLERSNTLTNDLLTEADIQHLPLPVQNYLRYTNAMGKPKVKNVRFAFTGEMRGRNKDWFKFTTLQYNFFNEPARLFFMKAQMFGITVPGYHKYQNETATMDIRLFGFIPVAQAKGPEMNTAETVTVFNEMCVMAPASLIDKRITWESVDSTTTKAVFTNGLNTISATLYFNETGQLINFVSDDRYDVNNMKQYRFSTPLKDYKLFDGRLVPGYGEGIWHYPEGEFVYGKFLLQDINYNVESFNN